MKILYVSWFDSKDGASVHANELLSSLRTVGNEVYPLDLKVLKKTNTNKLATKDRETNRLFKLANESIRITIKNIIRGISLYRKVKIHQPDIILYRYNLYDFSAVVVSRLYKIPLAYEINASSVFELKMAKKFMFKTLAAFIEKEIFKHSEKQILVSNDLLNYFKDNNFFIKNAIVIPNGVNFDNFKKDTSLSSEIRQIKNFKRDNNIVVGFVGSLQYWHGVDRLINVISKLVQINSNIKLVIIGEGTLKSDLKKQVESNHLQKHVFFTGYLDYKDIPSALKFVDIAVAPYRDMDYFYFSPLKVLDYMSAGKVVIAPPLGQIKELITSYKNGVLLVPNTDDCLINTIIELSIDEDLRLKLGSEAKKAVQENYTWNKIAGKITMELQNLIADKN